MTSLTPLTFPKQHRPLRPRQRAIKSPNASKVVIFSQLLHFWQCPQKILQRQLKCWYKIQEFLILFALEQILAMMIKVIGAKERRVLFCGNWRSTILVITFWDFLMFYQIFLSPQVKRIMIIFNKNGICELIHEL